MDTTQASNVLSGELLAAYETGLKVRELLATRAACRRAGDSDAARDADLAIFDAIDTVQGEILLRQLFTIGEAGGERPTWVTGWRLGGIPECGASYNHRDQRAEPGISLMAADGSDATPDGTFIMFNRNGRKRVNVAGWLVTHTTGSDGEPLIVGAVEIDQ